MPLKRVTIDRWWETYKKGDKPTVVVLTGAGISAESGLSTFRDSGGLWEKYPVYKVATPEAWQANPELVLEFYNKRRAQLKDVEPNAAHFALKEMESWADVLIITQNVDNLHERAGSRYVLHLHGELTKVRSEKDENLIYEIGYEPISLGMTAEDGAQLRPHVVWFGELVPMIEPAIALTEKADAFLIIGTSLVVYPAAGLIDYVPEKAPIVVVDPKQPAVPPTAKVHYIAEPATTGTPKAIEYLKERLLRD